MQTEAGQKDALEGLPPPRDRLPTLPFDLSEYALLCAMPDEDDELDFVAGPLMEVRLEDIPRLAVPLEALVGLEPRQHRLIAKLDGTATVDAFLDVAGMPREEAFAILCELVAKGVVTFGAGETP